MQIFPKIHQNGRSTKFFRNLVPAMWDAQWRYKGLLAWILAFLEIKSVRKKVLKYRKKTKVRTCKFFQKFTKMVDRRNFSETLFLPCGMYSEGTKASLSEYCHFWRLNVWARKCWNFERKLRSGHANFSKNSPKWSIDKYFLNTCSCHVGCTVKVQRPPTKNSVWNPAFTWLHVSHKRVT